jgi:hypothetical protein
MHIFIVIFHWMSLQHTHSHGFIGFYNGLPKSVDIKNNDRIVLKVLNKGKSLWKY